jgi:hypothetical protein
VHGGRARRTRRRHRAAGQRIHTAELAVGHAAADPVPGVPHGGYALASLSPKVSQKRCRPLPLFSQFRGQVPVVTCLPAAEPGFAAA